MKWLTQKYIKAQAKKSKRAAIKVSWEHWEQFATCTEKELRNAVDFPNRRIALNYDYCGLCLRYDGANSQHQLGRHQCPIKERGHLCCSAYSDAQKHFNNWYYDKKPYKEFHKAARAMADKLKSLLKPKKKAKSA